MPVPESSEQQRPGRLRRTCGICRIWHGPSRPGAPRRALGAPRRGFSALPHPHIHMIVPGGGISLDGERWVSSHANFLLPVRVLAKLSRRLFLTRLRELHVTGRLQFFADHLGLRDRRAFLHHLAPLRKKRWVGTPSHPSPDASGACLSRALHPSRRHFEPTADRIRQHRCHLPLQGLSPRRCRAPAHHDAQHRRVHPPLPAPRSAERLPPHTSLRLPRQR
jgi:hypothetical protein